MTSTTDAETWADETRQTVEAIRGERILNTQIIEYAVRHSVTMEQAEAALRNLPIPNASREEITERVGANGGTAIESRGRTFYVWSSWDRARKFLLRDHGLYVHIGDLPVDPIGHYPFAVFIDPYVKDPDHALFDRYVTDYQERVIGERVVGMKEGAAEKVREHMAALAA